jgi:hypothetical protein
MDAPPSRPAWLADGELHGHTVEHTIRWLSDTADWEDELAQRRAIAVPCAGEVWWRARSWLRRVLG